ncbi:rCG43949 [Rattus norvegicus]|uniref:RCG43949 n=1 Tax=Rattus norvegicus TaxID=10116 RepID=A6J7K3_RAT|nr:rCG43949 [Rattus norvegicus]
MGIFHGHSPEEKCRTRPRKETGTKSSTHAFKILHPRIPGLRGLLQPKLRTSHILVHLTVMRLLAVCNFSEGSKVLCLLNIALAF